MTIACHGKKNWVEKSKTQKSLGVLRNIDNFNHNSAENDDFDDGRIWKPKKPVRNLLDKDNSLPQEKKLGRKSKTQKSLGVLRNIISKKLRTNEKTILRMDEFENPKSRSGIY